MPIVSRELGFYRPQANGYANVCEYHVDHLGRIWPVRYPTLDDEATVIANMNARDLTPKLKLNELRRGYRLALATGNGRDPEVIETVGAANSDVTRSEMDLYIIRHAAKEEPDRVLALATWIAGFTVQQIAGATGFTTEKSQKILDRATRLRDDYAPFKAAEDANAEDLK